MKAEYNAFLVAVSLLIASTASYVALDLASRVPASMGRSRISWIVGSATTMGVGIWSMHFVGMLALRVSVPIAYNLPLVGLSALVAISGSAVTFMMSARSRLRTHELLLASMFMGPAIAGMHYIGMAAMRMPGRTTYDTLPVVASVVVAIGVSFLALQLAMRLRGDHTRRVLWLKVGSAGIMGAAVYGMHYTGMLAARFTYDGAGPPSGEWSIVGTNALAAAVTVSTAFVLTLGGLGAIVDRRIKVGSSEANTLRAEAELGRTTGLLRAVVEDSPEAIITTDLDFQVTRWNPAATKLLGWTADEIMGRAYMLVLPQDQLADPRFLSEPTTHAETVHLRKNGSSVDVTLSSAALRDQNGVATGYVFLLADATRRMRLEAQVRQSQRMEAVGQLAGGVAHDFNNLLTVIVSYSDFLLHSLEEADSRRDDVLEIQRAAERAAELTMQLLAFSRQQMIQPRLLAVNRVVEETFEMLRRLLPANIDLQKRLEEPIGNVHADRGQLEQILLNLIVNARDAMPNGGSILIETKGVALDATAKVLDAAEVVPGEFVLLSVSDTGTGISPEILGGIFEPFFTTKGVGAGTGLGLSTVYGIVKQHGGYISVTSEVGLGTTFLVYFGNVGFAPIQERDQRKRVVSLRGSETVLLVEDNEMVRRVARKTLTSHGYEVIEATNGSEALAIYDQRQDRIHLVVTDLVMPGMGGFDIDRALTARNGEARVLFMSGYSREAIAGPEGVPNDAAFLAKPFTPEELLGKVREVLDA